ncbi:hypothetical protein EVAR_44473_1 [Eumeta japonica]|uniref:Uncharacterized protein n=1 Tax=Eumeta variegata TaxID=151549 RepID=A0A4C1WJA6_EUMVA|nr:hypothetical protein EVAR_44473_1 [Eumeta japonica]
MDSKRHKDFLTTSGHLDLLRDFEVYCSSPTSSDQPNPTSDSETEVDANPNRELAKRPYDSREGFTQISKRKSRQPQLFVTYGPGFIRLSGKKPKASTSASPVTPLPTAAVPTTPAVIQSVKMTYYSTPWRTVGKSNSQVAPVPRKTKACKTAESSQPTKAVNSKVPTATIVVSDEADVIAPSTRKKLQRPSQLPFMIKAADQRRPLCSRPPSALGASNPKLPHFSLRRLISPATSGHLPKKPKRHPVLPIYDAPTGWWKLSQLSVASQGSLTEKPKKTAAPATAKNMNKKKRDEADVLYP